jgi:peptidoglycan/LPS O-acetylase OafA/YrhL
MYLWHPIVLFALSFSEASRPRYSAASLARDYAAVCSLTALVAAAAYVLVEAPFAALEKWAVDAGAAAAGRLLGGRARSAQ